MKKNFLIISLIISVLALFTISCKNDKGVDPTPTPGPNSWSPAPGADGTLPTAVLPMALADSVGEYFTVHTGENPPIFDGQFVSRPHVLMYSNFEDDSIGAEFNDRYIAFFGNNEFMDFYGQQWDDEYDDNYEEAYRKLYVLGTGDNFTCYYITEAYPNGMYAKQSTIFSGRWDASYGGLKDFQVAVILTETSGNPNLAPVGSFRVLGDGDGLAVDTAWIGSRRGVDNGRIITDEDAFRMFRVK